MAIIISKNGKNAKKVEKSSFEKEGYLQKYIYNNPESIPLYDIKEDIRLLILSREFFTNSGPIDALGIDKEGEIYLVETKLYKNYDKRLVVAQVLDYGASLWRSYDNFDKFINEVNDKFGVSFNQRVKAFFNIEDEEISALIENLKKNFNKGNFKFVVLMDKLHSQLKDLIIFINENSRFDIFAVEMEYYKHEDYEIMIPKLFGAEVKKDIGVSSSGAGREWDEKSFFEDVKRNVNDQQFDAVRKLYDFSKNDAEISWGRGRVVGTFNPKFPKINKTASLFTVRSNGNIALNLGTKEISPESRDKFKALIEKEKLFLIKKDNPFPEYKIDEWYDRVDDFISIISRLIKI